jgi:ComF family protein
VLTRNVHVGEAPHVSALAELLAVLVPPTCAACGAPTETAERLCAVCDAEMPWIPAHACARCALPSHRGRPCPAAMAAFDSATAAAAYYGPACALVRALKFRSALPVATLMAEQMAASLPDLDSVEVVPVPAARARRRRRGFDPAALLAERLATRLDLPFSDCLVRRRGGVRQVGATRGERRAQGRLVIAAHRDAPTHVLLVDDVHTTGATLDACARALRHAGSGRVDAVTYARTL